MARTSLEAAYRGGALSEQEKPAPKRLRYPCFANGCPMAGTMWPGAGVGGTGDAPGQCVYHYGINPSDIPRVTSVLQQWNCVAEEVQAARRCLTGDMASDPGGQEREFAAAWKRLQPSVATWEAELKPGNVRTSKGVERPFRESYGDWARRLEAFLGARVVEVLATRTRRSA